MYFFYPETKDRNLESIEALFSPKSPFCSAMERSDRENGDVSAKDGGKEAAKRRISVLSVESEKGGGRVRWRCDLLCLYLSSYGELKLRMCFCGTYIIFIVMSTL